MLSDVCGFPALSAAGLASINATSYHTRISQVTTAINRRAHRDVDSSEDFCLKEREKNKLSFNSQYLEISQQVKKKKNYHFSYVHSHWT